MKPSRTIPADSLIMVSWSLFSVLVLLLAGAVHGFLPVSRLIRARKMAGTSASSSSSSSSLASSLSAISKEKPISKRVRFLNKIGFRRTSSDNYEIRQAETRRKNPTLKYNVTTLAGLDSYFADEKLRFRDEKGDIDYEYLLKSLHVEGDTQIIGSPDHPDYTHPVAKIIHQRKRESSPYTTTGKVREDECRVALAIEGGGMRGCISAGMVCAIDHLNLTSAFDVVYGSSAGTIVGAYLITGQLPWFGPEVYYDCLTTAGKRFIDTRRLLRALGFGLLDPRLLKDVLTRPDHGKPVLNLPFLLNTTVQQTKPIDWDTFVEKQKVQPLKIIASGCKSEKAIVLDMESKSFESLPELADCMHASCLLPGIAGPLMNFDTRPSRGENETKFVLGNNLKGDHYEPLADALLFEPLPYRSAVEQGATHVVVLRSRPDGTDVTGKGGIFERLIFRRFFLRKNRLPRMFERLKMQLHKKLYAEDIIRLNDEANTGRDYKDTSAPHLMAIAMPPGSEEIARLETGRKAIFEGLRRGFARAYDALVEDPSQRGRGAMVAREYFPDEILDYDPLEVSVPNESAFSRYVREYGVSPKAWETSSLDNKGTENVAPLR